MREPPHSWRPEGPGSGGAKTASGESIGTVVLGMVLFIAGLASLLIPAIPVVFFGFLIFGPIVMISGVVGLLRKPPPPFTAPPMGYSPPVYGPPLPTVIVPMPPAPPTARCVRCGGGLVVGMAACPNCGAPVAWGPPPPAR